MSRYWFYLSSVVISKAFVCGFMVMSIHAEARIGGEVDC